jgi:hypothetical protein
MNQLQKTKARVIMKLRKRNKKRMSRNSPINKNKKLTTNNTPIVRQKKRWLHNLSRRLQKVPRKRV